MTAHSDIEARAAEWLAYRDSAEGKDLREAEFEAWLAESMANRVAYLRLEAAWNRADRLASLRAPTQPMLLRTEAPKTVRIPLYMRLAASLVVCAMAGAYLAWLGRGPEKQQSFATGIGGHETVALSDGSRIELNTDTSLRTGSANGRRNAWLDRGEAYFSIAHDPAHPFVVWAGKRSVMVLGTKFSVHRDGDRLTVMVEQGMVTVSDGARHSALLAQGDTADVTSASFLRAHETPEEMADALSWRNGLLVFDHETLAAAVAQFNRYNGEKLVVADAKAANLRIGGTFGCNNIAGFVRLLGSAFKLHEEYRGDTVIISR